MILVVDASVAISWIADDERSAYADAVLTAAASDRVVVPALWRWEIANTLVVLERRGRLADAGATYASVIRHLPIDVANDATHKRGLDEIELAQRHQLSVYDAAYLALAKSRELLLATLDKRLAGAASAEGFYFAA
jgi:predicted nucleic acid-binding protein